MSEQNVTAKGMDYLNLALWAFAGLGVEVIYAFLLEPFLYGKQMADWNSGQNIAHWIITCITWGIITYVLLRVAKQKYGFDIFAAKASINAWQWLGLVSCVVLSIAISYWDWNGFKVVKEFQYLGLLKFAFQYIYYAFETALFTLILVFGHKAFELWLGKTNFPYGGVVLALTWGLVHILTKGSILIGLLGALGGFMYGAVYLLTNRDIRKVLPILFLMFIM